MNDDDDDDDDDDNDNNNDNPLPGRTQRRSFRSLLAASSRKRAPLVRVIKPFTISAEAPSFTLT